MDTVISRGFNRVRCFQLCDSDSKLTSVRTDTGYSAQKDEEAFQVMNWLSARAVLFLSGYIPLEFLTRLH